MQKNDFRWLMGAMLLLLGIFGAVLWSKWNADGPGTHGGGEDLGRKEVAPMAAPMQPHQSALEQRRAARAVISGAVRDAAGDPIAGATVCVVATSTRLGERDTRRPRCTTSGEDGRYRVEDLFGVRQHVSAGAAGYLPADHVDAHGGRQAIDLRPGGDAKDVDLALERGGVEIRGSVRNLRGEAIADAWVESGGPESGTGSVWGRSREDGRFALWVRPGRVTVAAQATGHVPNRVTGPSEGLAFTLYLAPASVLSGAVLRAGDREPVVGALVRAEAGGDAVLTDAVGRFRFDALPPGAYQPRVEADDGFGVAREPVRLGLGEVAEPLALLVQPAVFVEGRIVDEDGEACDEGSLTLRDASGDALVDTTEPGGLVHVRGVRPGVYTVHVVCEGASSAERESPLIVEDEDVLAQGWTVKRGRAIAGVVVDAKGEPVAGATVQARPVGGGDGPPAVLSDERGRFLLRGLARGAIRVVPVAHAERMMPDAAVMVTIGDADIEGLRVVLAPTGDVRGKLHDAQGRPIAGAELSLRAASRTQTARAGDEGRFVFASAAVGRAELSASLDGAPLRVQAPASVTIRRGETTAVELVLAAPTGAITGVLRDAEGRPFAGALVEARPEGEASETTRGSWPAGGERPQLTDASGSFALTGLAADAYTVTARRVGGGEARREHVALGEALALTLAP